MSTIMIRVPRQKTEELKGMIEDGLRIFGRAMSLAEQMCESAEMGERGGYGDRDSDYSYGDRDDYEMMDERHYPRYPMAGSRREYGDRRGRSAITGRYTRM
ncbi:MAG: hypothetical protein NC344_10260 [Bacteroidales bacterium]|nr:hypothetical protein [Bacteroidales bacterium]MCM1148187.1 hypothetical protein [Bacteroidales bacterium]MCM1207086.1 hypothetical protein [Bacillota bacterium]MCM1510830.1 hypothetical protein [Clostridium sp.]